MHTYIITYEQRNNIFAFISVQNSLNIYIHMIGYYVPNLELEPQSWTKRKSITRKWRVSNTWDIIKEDYIYLLASDVMTLAL